MTTTLNRPATRRSKPRPVVTRRVPITVKPSVEEEERAQLMRDRISAAFALLFIVAMIAAVARAAMTGDASSADAMLDYPPMF